MFEENPEAVHTLVYEVKPGEVENLCDVYVPQRLGGIVTTAKGHHTRDISSC